MFITDDNKMAVLHMTKGKYTLTEKESVSATYREDAVDAREYQTVRVAETKKATFTAEGVLADGYTDFTVDQFRDLVGETVLYRGPRGYFYQVVITSVTFDTPVNIDPPVTTVKVSLIRISK